MNAVVLLFFLLTSSLFADAVGVLPFTAEKAEDGVKVAGMVQSALIAKKKFKFVEKIQLDSALNEIALSKTGIVKSDDAMELGKMAGASVLILGEVAHDKEKKIYTVSSRIVKTETGVVIAGTLKSSPDINKAATAVAAFLEEMLSIYVLMDNPDSPFIVKLKLDGGKNPKYKIGDKVKLTFRVESKDVELKECYIKIYDIDSDGSIIQIYPNKFSEDRKIKLGKDYVFPEEADDFEWQISGKPGFEAIQAVAVRLDVAFFKSEGDSFRKLGNDNAALYRGIVTKLKKAKLGDFSAERISYEIENNAK